MRLWLAHKVSGEDHVKLEEEMRKICGKLEELGVDYDCSFLDNEMKNKSKEELIKNAFNKIDKSDGVLVIVKSEDKSEGMLLEIGYAIAKQKEIILLIKKRVLEDRYTRAVATRVVEFDSDDDLINKVGEIK